MARMHAHGELDVGRDGVRPAITGRAFVTGFNQLVVDPDDPLGHGFFIPAAAG